MVVFVINMFVVIVDCVIVIRFLFRYVFMVIKYVLVGILVVWIIFIIFGVFYVFNLVFRMYIVFYCLVLLIIIMIMYVYIFIVVKCQENRIYSMQMGIDGVLVEKKVVKIIFMVVGVYVLCWLFLFMFLVIIDFELKLDQFKKGFNWVQLVFVCNLVINFFIYCLRCMKYCIVFGKIL